MRIRILAIGTRVPRWAQEACAEYLQRLQAAFQIELIEIAAGKRSPGIDPSRAIQRESTQLARHLRPADHVVALDERGRELTTRTLASWLGARRSQGSDVALLIGGPDGLTPEIRARSHETLSLSRLTLPHALARVVLIEQLYRAHSILAGHPYHRD